MNTKYTFTGKTKIIFGITLKQIKRVLTDEVGGWIENEINLSIYGNAWVYGNAQVYGNAWVSGNAQVLKSPINIIGLPYQVTIMETHISIGCYIKTITEWKSLTEAQAEKLDSNGKAFYRFFKHTILSLIAYREGGM